MQQSGHFGFWISRRSALPINFQTSSEIVQDFVLSKVKNFSIIQ